ncbi:hypothetical protein FUAX_17820 [Fulvitalea axinellae]|uniref:Uncharacterized protein n=1 Tax=Fulvitalea axinellae TaxID=1182444 RepID=A0AAU9CJ68_9BACT|nr:hypothetical protein FUAX_17820 [Fulvitalea axinellae]
MVEIIQDKLDIRLDFDPDVEDPSRLFRAFAEIIDSVNSLDLQIARSIDPNVENKLFLKDIEKGSLIAKLEKWITLDPSNELKITPLPESNDVREYLNESRQVSLKSLNSDSQDLESLERLTAKIDDIAKSKNIDKYFNYKKVEVLPVAENLNKISHASNKLADKETFDIISNHDSTELNNTSPKINIEDIKTALTSEVIENTTTEVYKIKKPDFLGESRACS